MNNLTDKFAQSVIDQMQKVISQDASLRHEAAKLGMIPSEFMACYVQAVNLQSGLVVTAANPEIQPANRIKENENGK